VNIAFLAQDNKKELMVQFCIASCGILAKHDLYATAATGKMVEAATGLKVNLLLPGPDGGSEQLASRVEYGEIDLVIAFRDPTVSYTRSRSVNDLLRSCDSNNIPVATNAATAEILLQGLSRGDFSWRDMVHHR